MEKSNNLKQEVQDRKISIIIDMIFSKKRQHYLKSNTDKEVRVLAQLACNKPIVFLNSKTNYEAYHDVPF